MTREFCNLPRSILVDLILVVLLVCASSLAAVEYVQNNRLLSHTQQLEEELASQSERLQAAENQKRDLQDQANQSRAELDALQTKIADLEGQIQKLQDQLKLQNYITIGLTFLWSPQANVGTTDLPTVVQQMNEGTWEKMSIYFFIYHAEPRDFMPAIFDCAAADIAWVDQAMAAYPERDIPIGIFVSVGSEAAACAVNISPRYAIAIPVQELRGALTEMLPLLLSHELLHVFGFTDKELIVTVMLPSGLVIPPEWASRIQTKAKWFQMPPPS